MKSLAMTRPFAARGAVALALVLLTVGTSQAQENRSRPRISTALRTALEKEAPAAVEKRFLEALTPGRQEYVVDMKELNELGVEYMQKGDTERGRVVMAIAVQAAQLMMQDMLSPEMRAAAAAGQAQNRARPRPRVSEEEQARRRSLQLLGPSRDDLDRFHGLYGHPEDHGTRNVFLVRNCDGHLVIGAAWGDVAPWPLRSMGDTKFQYPGQDLGKPIHVEVVMDAGGRPARLIHDLPFISSPLPRVDDLPENFQPRCTG